MEIEAGSEMNSFAIARALHELASLLRIKGGEKFRALAYDRGAEVVAALGDSLATLVKQDRLTEVDGIGQGIAGVIKDLYFTGSSSLLERLRDELPPGALELAQVPGLTLNKIKKLSESLNITSIEELKTAI